MKVLMVTGDKNVLVVGTDAFNRFLLQRDVVDDLQVTYWGRGEREIDASGFDVVTVQDPYWRGLAALQAARRAKAKLQVQVHTDFNAQSLFKKMLGAYVLRRADSVRVVSDRIKEQLERLRLRVPVTVLPVFIDLQKINSALTATLTHTYPQFEKYMLVAARLEKEKDVAAVIRALPAVRKYIPDVLLIIAGKGSQENHLKHMVKSRELEGNVVFLGFQDEIYPLFKAADVVVNTSRFEGYGATIVEALAAGCPVVSYDVGVAEEAGAVIATPATLADKIIEVLRSEGRADLRIPLLTAHEWSQKWKESLPS